MWVTIFALIVFGIGGAGFVGAMFGPGMEGMEPYMAVSWGGRHLGLGLAALAAVLLKSPTAYMVAFIGGVGRDIGDLIAHFDKPEMSIGVLVGIIVFLVADVLGALMANKARSPRSP